MQLLLSIKCIFKLVINELYWAVIRKKVMNDCPLIIMKTCPCNEYPLTPHSYIVKLGFTGVYFFLTFALKHRLWVLVSLIEAVLTCTHYLCFSKNMKIILEIILSQTELKGTNATFTKVFLIHAL